MIPNILGGVVAVFFVVIIVGGLTGRVRLKGCCGIADPSEDLRTGDAAEEGNVKAAGVERPTQP